MYYRMHVNVTAVVAPIIVHYDLAKCSRYISSISPLLSLNLNYLF